MSERFDLVVKAGRVADGTGTAALPGRSARG
jgi:N-acyl-D-aspartate/D-glutamate deacylase